MNYLRSVLQPNFIDEEDYSYLMVSCPRVPGFELLVVDFALKLLLDFGSKFLLQRSTLENDLTALKSTKSFEEQMILQYNISLKSILQSHITFL